MVSTRGFASDNHAGVHPAIFEAMNAVNHDHVISYGEDKYTAEAVELFRKHFGKKTEPFFVYNGTAANILGISNVTRSYHAIICAETAHLNVHECGGPEKFTGCKLLTMPTKDGKLTPDKVASALAGINDPHYAQPKVLSITEPTELGTLYTYKELRQLTDFAHDHNLIVHMDGARLCNAAAALDTTLQKLTQDAGVDILSFGGTKNGTLCSEAVVFFNKSYAEKFDYIRKQGMQLASKMRYISAQFIALLSSDLWLKNAQHANHMAQYLYRQVKDIKQVTVTQKVETNAVFAQIPLSCIVPLQQEYFFYIFDEHASVVRWMCSYDTTREDVDDFVACIKQVVH